MLNKDKPKVSRLLWGCYAFENFCDYITHMKRLSLKTRLSIYTIDIYTMVVVVDLSLISIALKDLVPEEH